MDHVVMDKYQPVIGLEVHVQLRTQSKIFSGDDATYGTEPNTQVGVITLAHPGTLPKLNRKVLEQAIKMGLACHSEIARYQIFDRKNYFYPDLPKGYQLTQDRTPICKGGYINISIESHTTRIELNRIHLEEDAGKSIHLDHEPDTLIDLNRSGVPLIEIVTEPMLKTAEEAGALLSEIRKLVRYLQISDGNMEEGSLRCDANISVMKKGSNALGKKVEVKNMNSIRNVQHAIDFEIERQIKVLESGNIPLSETRTFDAASGTTSGMRTKEELNDYRYFPDPDLSPLTISDAWLEEIKISMPALPEQLVERFVREYQLPEYDARVLTETRELAEYFLQVCQRQKNYKGVSNWIMGPIKSYLNNAKETEVQIPVHPDRLAELIDLVEASKISHTAAVQQLFPVMLVDSVKSPLQIAVEMDLIQNSDEDQILKMVEEVLQSNTAKVAEYKKGKKGLIAMFMGEVMKKSKGKADPKVTSRVLQQKLKEQ